MTTAVFKQLEPVAIYLIQGCSSVALPSPNIVGGHHAAYGGSGGAAQHTRTVAGSATGASSHVILALWHTSGFPDGNYWEAGDWICRLNLSDANRFVTWTSVHICANRGSDWTTIASDTSVGIPLTTTGTKTVTLTTGSPSDFTSAGAQTIYWIYGFQKSTTAEQTFKYKSNKNLATPIVAKAFVPTATFASAPIAPTYSGGTVVPTPVFIAPLHRANVAASHNERLAVSNGEAVRASASIAMESRFALASGGPEAFSLGQG